MRPKISSDYLENLRVKFLDTRNHQLENTSAVTAQLASSSSTADAATTKEIPAIPDEKPPTAGFSVQDFEQLIYANALAKRADEAEQAFNLMEVRFTVTVGPWCKCTLLNRPYFSNRNTT